MFLFFIWLNGNERGIDMNKIVPFKKDIIFKTNIDEVTSISLEHSLHVVDSNMIRGSFLVSGEYKITEVSVNTEVFHYELPFDITLDDRYILDNVTVDIDDFYYEIINENVLSVHIEVLIDHLEEKEEEIRVVEMEPLEEVKEGVETIQDAVIEEVEKVTEMPSVSKVEREEVMVEESVPVNSSSATSLDSVVHVDSGIFDAFSEKETYMTYKVYIIREGDSIESVMNKYGVMKEELEQYNDLREIKLGDKLIIPSTYHEEA